MECCSTREFFFCHHSTFHFVRHLMIVLFSIIMFLRVSNPYSSSTLKRNVSSKIQHHHNVGDVLCYIFILSIVKCSKFGMWESWCSFFCVGIFLWIVRRKNIFNTLLVRSVNFMISRAIEIISYGSSREFFSLLSNGYWSLFKQTQCIYHLYRLFSRLLV